MNHTITCVCGTTYVPFPKPFECICGRTMTPAMFKTQNRNYNGTRSI